MSISANNSKLEVETVETVPVIKERVIVDKLATITGEVTINVTPVTETVTENVKLQSVNYRQEVHPVDEIVSERPEVRQEGNVTIIPVLKEEVVMVKRLRLVEEVHLIKEVTTNTETHEIDLRHDEVSITRQ